MLDEHVRREILEQFGAGSREAEELLVYNSNIFIEIADVYHDFGGDGCS